MRLARKLQEHLVEDASSVVARAQQQHDAALQALREARPPVERAWTLEQAIKAVGNDITWAKESADRYRRQVIEAQESVRKAEETLAKKSAKKCIWKGHGRKRRPSSLRQKRSTTFKGIAPSIAVQYERIGITPQQAKQLVELQRRLLSSKSILPIYKLPHILAFSYFI